MTITTVGSQAGGVTFDNTTSSSRAFGANVTAGNLIVVCCWKITIGGTDPFAAGDCTKSAGTATVGTISLDASVEFQHDAGSDRVAVGIWSCIVTGTGSCTMQVAGMTAGSYGGLATDELNTTASWDSSRVEATNTNSNATDGVTSATTNDGTSAGIAAFFACASIPAAAAETITPDAAFTQIYEEEDGSIHQPGSAIRRIVSTGTTDAGTWTLAGNNHGYTAALAVYKEAGAASAALEESHWLTMEAQSNPLTVSVW